MAKGWGPLHKSPRKPRGKGIAAFRKKRAKKNRDKQRKRVAAGLPKEWGEA